MLRLGLSHDLHRRVPGEVMLRWFGIADGAERVVHIRILDERTGVLEIEVADQGRWPLTVSRVEGSRLWLSGPGNTLEIYIDLLSSDRILLSADGLEVSCVRSDPNGRMR